MEKLIQSRRVQTPISDESEEEEEKDSLTEQLKKHNLSGTSQRSNSCIMLPPDEKDTPMRLSRAQSAELSQSTTNMSTPTSVKKKSRRRRILMKVNTNKARSEIDVLRLCFATLGWKESLGLEEDAQIVWFGLGPSDTEILKAVSQSTQKVNRFPGMTEMARKRDLCQVLNRYRRIFPKEFNFYPKTWLLPDESSQLESEMNPKKTYIVKPSAGCQGDGIYLVKRYKDIQQLKNGFQRSQNYVVQQYLTTPLLIDGKKFDLRLYVFVTSMDPLICFICTEGMGRFCTENYEKPSSSNMHKVFMHLTNYSLNKNNENFVATEDADNGDEGSKRTLTSVLESIRQLGHDTTTIWNNIRDVVTKTMIAISPILANHYNALFPEDEAQARCFHLIGFDLMIDSKLRPWLLEINANPSLRIDMQKEVSTGVFENLPSPLDQMIKETALCEALKMVTKSPEELSALDEFEHYQRLSPPTSSSYEQYLFFDQAREVYEHFTGVKGPGQMNSARFSRFARFANKLSTVCSGSRLVPADFDIIFKNLTRKTERVYLTLTDFFDFIVLLAARTNPERYESTPAEAIQELVDDLYELIEKVPAQ
eukprot:GILJ01008572.1.p1 GENE.GILJ01008572.1~~GILJ01008572.1.p1  ORF type:complete len:685 (+),score=114.58 GILJ01008572.1:277-2055(+)